MSGLASPEGSEPPAVPLAQHNTGGNAVDSSTAWVMRNMPATLVCGATVPNPVGSQANKARALASTGTSGEVG